LLELLRDKATGGDAAAALAARLPAHEPRDGNNVDSTLNEVLSRITQLTGKDVRRSDAALDNPSLPFRTGSALAAATVNAAATETNQAAGNTEAADEFVPIDPSSIRDAGLTDSEVEALILKYLLSRGDCTGREVADQIKLPFILIDPLLR